MRNGRRAGRATVVAALAGMCAFAGCASSHGAADAHSTTSSTSSATTGSATTTSPDASAVLAAYRAGWTAFEQALADGNPNAPTLAATMVDPQLQGARANLLSDQIHGMIGPAKITSLTAARAPVAKLSVTPNVAGQPSGFDASASTVAYGTIASYAWNFGDGTSATTTHTYSSPAPTPPR
jgi:PKD domain